MATMMNEAMNSSNVSSDIAEKSAMTPASSIQPMDETSVQRIVAGQAVTDLSSAVKELVDNALDAGAKSINIRLFNQGLDVLEVSDDGSGVPIESRPHMAMKHATSKIRSFDDIYSSHCSTLGFRGEALFCLANISESLVIATRTAADNIGQKMEFRSDGTVKPETVCNVARKPGTTVAVVKLFHNLPVRRNDMMKRIKQQRSKLLSMIQGYAILCTGVRFNLMDIVGKSSSSSSSSFREDVKLSTSNASTTIEQTVSSVLGSKFLAGTTKIDVDLSTSTSIEGAKLEGLVSKAPALTNGAARDGSVAREAQFFSINGRPVEMPKVSRALSEAWRVMEGTKKRPACVLCFTLPQDEYDINLAPNKREVLLTHEAAICSVVQEAVATLWASQQNGSFTANEVHLEQKQAPERSQPPPSSGAFSDASSPGSSPSRRMKRRNAFVHDFRNARLQHEEEGSPLQPSGHAPMPAVQQPPARPRQASLGQSSSQVNLDIRRDEGPTDEERIKWAAAQMAFNQGSRRSQRDEIERLPTDITRRAGPSNSGDMDEGNPVTPLDQDTRPLRSRPAPTATPVVDEVEQPPRKKAMTLEDFAFRPVKSASKPSAQLSSEASSQQESNNIVTRESVSSRVSLSANNNEAAHKPVAASIAVPASKKLVTPAYSRTTTESQIGKQSEISTMTSVTDSRPESAPSSDQIVEDNEPATQETQVQTVLWESFGSTEAVIEASRQSRLDMRSAKQKLRAVAKSRKTPFSQDSEASKVGESVGVDADDENDNDAFDEAASSSNDVVRLSKNDFADMEIIGQFNLGFILAKCRNNNLWILDQHACDEKFNFERLCRETVIHEQKLMAPMPLELSVSEESCILEHLDVFEANGFRFQHDPDKPPRHRLSLAALPHSGAQDGRKAVQFGKDDVRALCAILETQDYYEDDPDGGGTGVDGSGLYGNNAVRRYAGGTQSQLTQSSSTSSNNADKVIARLPKAIAMFANRACRGSIMIGTALSQKEMESVVRRLSEVQHPWNCPHGRPTMRHVRDIQSILLSDEKQAAELIAGPTVSVLTQEPLSQEDQDDE